MTNRRIIDKGMIEEFGEALDSNSLRNAIYSLSDIIEDSSFDLSQSNKLIKVQNIDLLPFGDYSTNTEIPSSEIDLYLTIRSAQIELNSVGPMEKWWKVYLNKIRIAWKNRKANTKKAKRKASKLAKKTAKILTPEQLSEKKDSPYTIIDLKNDFFANIVERLTDTTVIYNQPTKIRILAKEEFGYKINIIPAFKHDDGLKIWDTNKNKFILTKPLEAKSFLENKNIEINKNNKSGIDNVFYKIIRIFKNLYFSLNKSANYQFIESLIYNCPTALFDLPKDSTTYDIFIKVLNFLSNTDFSKYRSIYNDEKLIFEQDNISLYATRNFIKSINEYLI